MKTRILLILLALTAATVSVAAYIRNAHGADTPRYTTAHVSRGPVVDAVEASGALEAVTTVQVGTQVSGVIKTLYADFNSTVRKGQIVAELDPSLFQTQVDQAAATVARLQSEVERARGDIQDTQTKLSRAHELWDRQLIPKTDLETADSNARQAEAALKSAQAQVAQSAASLRQAQVTMAHTIIRAPIDGVVISRAVDVGQTVAASTSAPTLFVIANDLEQMRVNARIDEADIGRVAPGQHVTFKVDAYPGETFTGTVSQVRLDPVTEQNVVSYVTIIDVPNPGLKLKPGMTANVTVEIARADNVLRVPNAALRFRPAADGAQVWVADGEGQPTPEAVRTGLTDGTMTAIVDGTLGDHAQVITGLAAPGAAAAPASGSPLIPFGGRRGAAGGAGQAAGGRRTQGVAR